MFRERPVPRPGPPMASIDRLRIHARLYHRRKTDKPAALLGWVKQSMTACSELPCLCVWGIKTSVLKRDLIDPACASRGVGVDFRGRAPHGRKLRHRLGIVVAEVVIVVAAATAAAAVVVVVVVVVPRGSYPTPFFRKPSFMEGVGYEPVGSSSSISSSSSGSSSSSSSSSGSRSGSGSSRSSSSSSRSSSSSSSSGSSRSSSSSSSSSRRSSSRHRRRRE